MKKITVHYARHDGKGPVACNQKGFRPGFEVFASWRDWERVKDKLKCPECVRALSRNKKQRQDRP